MKKLLLNPVKIFKFALLFCVLWQNNGLARNSVKSVDGRLIFHYDLRHEPLITRLIDQTKLQRARLFSFFDEQSGDDEPVQIYITRYKETYQSLVQKGIPEWSQAVAFPSRRVIVIKVTTAEEIQRLPEVLLHELVHVGLYDYAAGDLPVWIHEGLAQWLSKQRLSLQEKLRIGNALAANRLVSFKSMDSLLTFHKAKAELVYDLAYTAMDFLMERYGEEKVRFLLKRWRANRDYDANFYTAFGSDFIDFEVEWYAWLEKRYRWMILLNF